MANTQNDFMQAALDEARAAIWLSEPNPRVGCIITSASGQVLGRGHTQQRGGPHAEIMALRDAATLGREVKGSTAWVTLEPCSHHGFTGPCCDAQIAAGISRVVACAQDPNPLVGGQGFERLRAAGVEVEIAPGGPAARELNIGFFSRMIRKTPWVRMKIAASLDGTTALADGASQWITSQAARTDGHAWRARAGAVLTGIGTVRQDNPRLDVRLVESPRQPPLVIVDSRLETPLDAKLFIEGRRVLIYAAQADVARIQALQARGAEVTLMPGPDGKVDLAAMLRDLATRREVNELHVEAGHKLNGSLLREGLVDELLVYLAPKLLGPGQGMASFGPLASLDAALTLEFVSTDMIGPDLRVVARGRGRAVF